MQYIDLISSLIAELTKLPSVGQRTAYRYAYALLNMSEGEVEKLANTIIDVKRKVRYCKLCGNYTDSEVCELCENRDKSTILVVSEPRDMVAIENSKNYNGVYHILMGVLSPRDNIGPEKLRIKELLMRLEGVKEIIIATNPSSEGEVTAIYLANLIRPLNIKVTRIATGIPIGSHIEYADEDTLSRALSDRKEI